MGLKYFFKSLRMPGPEDSPSYKEPKGPLHFPDRFANAISKIYSEEPSKRKHAVTCDGWILNPYKPKPGDITNGQGRVPASSRGYFADPQSAA